MKNLIALLILGMTNMLFSTAMALDACAMSEQNGGTPLVVVTDPISATSWGFPKTKNQIRRDVAEEAQEEYGNTVAYDSEVGITVQFTVKGGGTAKVYNLPVLNYSGTMSIEYFILSSLLPDDERPTEDPSPCDPSKNATNGSNQTSGGGGGSGSYFYGGASLWPGTIYVVQPRYSNTVDCQQNPAQCGIPDDERAMF